MKPSLKIARSKLFGRFDYYLLDLEHKSYRQIKPFPAIEAEGTVHYFLWRPVFLFRHSGDQFIWMPSEKDPVVLSQVDVKFDVILKIVKRMRLKIGERHYTYLQLNWTDLDAAIDPTYDYLDRWASDYMFQIKDARERQIKNEKQRFG